MKAKLNTVKTDLYHVFVEGNADNVEKARVFVMLFVPLMTAIFSAGGFIK